MQENATRLRVKNTLTNKLEPFEPKEPGHVRMYVCGPSVYDESHLGHARSYVAYDAMKRYFLATGLRVTHVQNFTDVEENISRRAAEEGIAPLAYADRLIEHFFRDMDALRILRATHYPRVTENVERVIEIVKDLQEKGIAYCVDCGPRPHLDPAQKDACDVYFCAERAPSYGLLAGATIEELTVDHPMSAGERRHPLDFALWKSRDDWGVTWPSVFGEGRPGWHVECTAMATRHLGADFDIHGGGMDLIFPHHDSERVIGEAWLGERYCRYYLHNGFVTVGDIKMSKSLGNFVTVSELLSRHEPEVLRTFLLEQHYRAPLNYDSGAIARTQARVERWRALVAQVQQAAGDRGEVEGAALAPSVAKAMAAFWAALEDDFQFGRTLDALDAALDAAVAQPDAAPASLAALRRAARALGVLWALDDQAP